jgi:diguanylate cyclase (GGDEF)-like protein
VGAELPGSKLSLQALLRPALPSMTDPVAIAALVEQAWQQAYLDPFHARALGQQVVQASAALTPAQPVLQAWGWLHVALADVRIGDADAAHAACMRSRDLFLQLGEPRGISLCDEVLAIYLRRTGDYAAAEHLLAEIDARTDRGYTDNDQFIAHNARAIVHKLKGRSDDALRHFYLALHAAQRTGWVGPLVSALGNLGGYHHDLFNLEDARVLSEQAFEESRKWGVRPALGTSCANLISIYDSMGQPDRARAMADFILAHPSELVPDAADMYMLSLAQAFVCSGDIDSAQRYLDRGSSAAVVDGDGVVYWAWLQARCRLARHDAAAARELAERVLDEREAFEQVDQPYDLMQLRRTAADACEWLGDLGAALRHTQHAHAIYEELVGRSARARYLALQASFDMAQAQQDRDLAQRSHRQAEEDRARLVRLNRALRAQIVETEALQAQLREQALRDALTGLHNRRYLQSAGVSMLERAAREAEGLCVVMLDIDRFKQVNDSLGHDAGDALLVGFSRRLLNGVRRGDLVCRFGGEEFVVLMPDVDAEQAIATMARLLETMKSEPIALRGGDSVRCSFSAGVAEYPLHGGTLDALIGSADKALYEAKQGGRGRVDLFVAA